MIFTYMYHEIHNACLKTLTGRTDKGPSNDGAQLMLVIYNKNTIL